MVDGLGASGGDGLRKEKECFTGRRKRVGIVIITVISDVLLPGLKKIVTLSLLLRIISSIH